MAEDRAVSNRRFKLGLLWAALINVNYYLVYFMGKEQGWFLEYAKSMSFWFAVIIGGLTLTDIGWAFKEVFGKGGANAQRKVARLRPWVIAGGSLLFALAMLDGACHADRLYRERRSWRTGVSADSRGRPRDVAGSDRRA